MASDRGKQRVRLLLAVVLSVLFFAATVWGFLYVWNEKAVTIDDQVGFTFQGATNTEVVSANMTVSNYVPSTNFANITLIYSNTSEILNANQISRLNLTIEQTSFQSFYGSKPLGAPSVQNGVPAFSGISTNVLPLSQLNFRIKYHYSFKGFGPLVIPSLVIKGPETFFCSILGFCSIERTFLSNPFRSASVSVPMLVFIGLGASIAWIRAKQLTELRAAICGLEREMDDELKKNLVTLAYKPNVLGYGLSTIFAPAITLFKVMAHRTVTSLDYQRKWKANILKAPGATKDGSKKGNDTKLESNVPDIQPTDVTNLDDFLSNDATSPAATLFDFRTISLVVGFLASIGLTFGFNAGAIGPFLIAASLAYLSVNFGFLGFMVGKKPSNILVLIAVILVTFIVLSISDIITTIRIFTFQ